MHDAVDIRLRVAGREYADINDATWTRSMEQIADTLSIRFSEKWMLPGNRRALPFRNFDACEFVIDGKVALTGYITSMPRGYSGDGPRQLELTAMSKSWLVVRSSYVGTDPTKPEAKPRRTWKDATLMQIVRDVFAQHSIPVTTTVDRVDDELFSRFGASVGETAWSVAQRALRARGLWARSRADGSVEVITADDLPYNTPFVGPDAIGREPTILSANFADPTDELFSEVIVVGQSGKRAGWQDTQAAHGWAKVLDESVPLYSPLVIHETAQSKQKELDYRAGWEVRTRAGRARRVTVTVQGVYWDKPNLPSPASRGQLLETNRVVKLIDPGLDIESNFLIASVVTSFGGQEGGTTSTLDFMPSEAFERMSPLPRRRNMPRDRKGRFVEW